MFKKLAASTAQMMICENPMGENYFWNKSEVFIMRFSLPSFKKSNRTNFPAGNREIK